MGGKLILTTPNANGLAHKIYKEFWRGLEPPRHIQIFTPNSLEDLVRRAGFSEVQVRTLSTGAAGIYKVSACAASQPELLKKTITTLKSPIQELIENNKNKNNIGSSPLK